MNQLNLAAEVINFFDQALQAPKYAPCRGCGVWKMQNRRNEKAEVWIASELDWLPQLSDWKALRSVILVYRKLEDKKGKKKGTTYQA